MNCKMKFTLILFFCTSNVIAMEMPISFDEQIKLEKDLFEAIEEQNLQKIRDLIRKNKVNVNVKKGTNRTPLIEAVLETTEPFTTGIVKELIKANADPNEPDLFGNTPLHYLARNGNLVLIKYLIENGARFNLENTNKMTPAELAYINKHLDVVNYLNPDLLIKKSFEVQLKELKDELTSLEIKLQSILDKSTRKQYEDRISKIKKEIIQIHHRTGYSTMPR